MQVAELSKQVTRLTLENERFKEQLRLSRHRQFGASREKLEEGEAEQLDLFNEVESTADESAPEQTIEEIEVTYKRRKRVGKRDEDLSGLPTEHIDYELPEEDRVCPECGEKMVEIGVDVRRELTYIPAHVKVVEHARHTYACRHCAEIGSRTPIAKADAPEPLIPKSIASASLVAAIAEDKYVNAMPLYRQEKAFGREGIAINRQNMANWLIYVCENLLLTFYKRLIAFVIACDVIHADETTLQVLHEPGRSAKQKSYIWLYRTSGCAEHSVVIYEYRETRQKSNPMEFLKDFKGFVHCDGYEAYHKLPPQIVSVGCWAHTRRKFFEALKALPKESQAKSAAARGLAFIDNLFEMERGFKNLPPIKRFEERLAKSKPIAEEFFAWANRANAVPQFSIGQAITYALNQRKYLMNVFLDGRLELSNNRAERSIRPAVIGRKNWLFANTPKGATASVILYSILETAKANNLHPRLYLQWLLAELPRCKESELDRLLPWADAAKKLCGLCETRVV